MFRVDHRWDKIYTLTRSAVLDLVIPITAAVRRQATERARKPFWSIDAPRIVVHVREYLKGEGHDH